MDECSALIRALHVHHGTTVPPAGPNAGRAMPEELAGLVVDLSTPPTFASRRMHDPVDSTKNQYRPRGDFTTGKAACASARHVLVVGQGIYRLPLYTSNLPPLNLVVINIPPSNATLSTTAVRAVHDVLAYHA